jgi:phosphoglycerate dehydrogenase-like enzyme
METHMRILVFLAHAISAFAPNQRQIAALEERLAKHTLVTALSEVDFLHELPSADAVVVWRFPVEWYDAAPRLRYVCTPSAGRERIAADPSARSTRHFGTFHGQIMAESLLAMMLFMNRLLGDAYDAQRARRWAPRAFTSTRPLAGQTALLLGYGAIGKHAARVLSATGMHVHGLKRDVTRGAEGVERLFSPEQLLAAVALADHIACLLPSDTGSDRLLDGRVLERMKASAFVYNLGRGNAIDIDALQTALREARIAGAFLDVLPEEPLPADSPLWTTANLYFTPHASAVRADYLDLYFAELGELFA